MQGFINGVCQNQNDNFYMHNHDHTAYSPPPPGADSGNGHRFEVVHGHPSRDLRRRAAKRRGQLQRLARPVLLEVFSTGTAATSFPPWKPWRPRRIDRDEQGSVVRTRQVPSMHKVETEFVDRVEHRLS